MTKFDLQFSEKEIKRLKFILEDEIDFLMSILEDYRDEVYILNRLYCKIPGIVNKRCEKRVRKAFRHVGLEL